MQLISQERAFYKLKSILKCSEFASFLVSTFEAGYVRQVGNEKLQGYATIITC